MGLPRAIDTFLPGCPTAPKELDRLMIEDGLPLEVETGTGDLSPLFGGVLLGSGVDCRSLPSRSRGFSDAVRRLEGDLTNLPGFKVSPLH